MTKKSNDGAFPSKISINDLVAAEYNPRKISKKAMNGLQASIERFGDISGVTFNKRSGRLVSGHQRVDVLRKKGGQVIDGAIQIADGSRFPIRVVDWDESTEKAANMAANNYHAAGEFTEDAVGLLKEIELAVGADTFGELAFDDLLGGLGALEVPSVDDVDEDDIPETAETRCQPGDVWCLGGHRLVCGDSTDPEVWKALMQGKKAALWLTDPPYNVAYEGGTREKLTIKNDSMPGEKFRAFLVSAFKCALSALPGGGSFYIWHPPGPDSHWFRCALRENDAIERQSLIWKKNAMVLGRSDYHHKHEPCLYGWKGGGAHGWYSDRKQTTILEFDRPSRSEAHPTMKPVKMIAYQIQNSCPPGGLVIDGFLGSGTTMIAAEQTGRTCYGIELDPKFCDVIIQRWEDLTGGKATKES